MGGFFGSLEFNTVMLLQYSAKSCLKHHIHVHAKPVRHSPDPTRLKSLSHGNWV